MNIEHLRREVQRFHGERPIEEASTPPASWYVDPAFYALEQQTVFGTQWCAAARIDQLAKPGQFTCIDVAGEPLVLVRDTDGEVRGFHNVCRHHAAVLLENEGTCNELVCPYHAWTYGLDGKLKKAPDVGAIKDFDRDTLGLVPVHTRVWGPIVFVSLAEKPRSMEEDFGPLYKILADAGINEMKWARRKTWDLRCNWKVFIDNYLDGGYHIAHAHKGLASELDLKTYRTEVFDRYSIQYSDGSGKDKRVGRDEVIYAWMYPNFMINRYGDGLDTNWVLPLAHDRLRVMIDYYFLPDAGAELGNSFAIQDEDIWLCETVQRGLGSRAYDQGRYSAKREHAAYRFHQMLAADFAV